MKDYVDNDGCAGSWSVREPTLCQCVRQPVAATSSDIGPAPVDGVPAVLGCPPVPTESMRAERRRHITLGVGRETAAVAPDIVADDIERQAMAKVTVELLVDDLDGSEGAETVRLGWNGDWREIDLSKRNRASLSRALDKYWNAARPVSGNLQPSRRRRRASRTSSSRSTKAKRNPKVIRAWATENGIAVPARGRIPSVVERQYNEATRL